MATRYGVPEGIDAVGLADRLRRPRALLRPGRVGDRRLRRVLRAADRPLRALARRTRCHRCATTRSGVAFGAAADRLGWGWGPVPFAINSVPRAGRAACVHCSQCLGHASPVDAKNGTHNTVIPRAVASGNCDLLVRAQVVAIERDGRARPAGASTAAPSATVRCDRVVVCAGAVETPRLLLASGLGNDVVGTNLHNHSFVMLYGTADEPLERFEGPGHSVATLDFVHRDGEAWGGGVLFDAPSLLPVVAARHRRRGSATRRGAPATRRGCATACATSWAAWASARRSRPRARASRSTPTSATCTACRSRACTATSTRRRSRCATTWSATSTRGWTRSASRTAVRLQLRPPARRRRRALRGHLPDGRGPGHVGLRPRRPRARQPSNVYVADASLLQHQRRREPVRDHDGQRVARRRGARRIGGLHDIDDP